MNTQKSSKMPYLVLILIVGVAFLFYLYMSSNSSSTNGLTLEEVNYDNQAAASRILNLLNEISALRIDDKFFTDPSYKTLRDYSVEIPELPIGRSNPFSPVPGMPSISPGPAGK